MFAASLILLRACGGICVLRLNPQDIPASRRLLQAALGMYLAVNVAISLVETSLSDALVFGLVSTAFEIALTIAALSVRGYPERVVQTLTALFGTGVLIGIPAWAMRYWFSVLHAQDMTSNLADNLWVGIFVWNLFVIAHILRHALNIRLFNGFLVAIAYSFIIFQFLLALQHLIGPTAPS